jgi:hypothetical protein
MHIYTGAAQIRLTFISMDTENPYDYVSVYQCMSANCTLASAIYVARSYYWQTITSSSGYMLVRFTSDASTVGSGFVASWTSTPQRDVSAYVCVYVYIYILACILMVYYTYTFMYACISFNG